MFTPGIDRGEAIRLINEIALSDVWVTITGNISSREIILHSDKDRDRSLSLITSYILSDSDYREKLLSILKKEDLL